MCNEIDDREDKNEAFYELFWHGSEERKEK